MLTILIADLSCGTLAHAVVNAWLVASLSRNHTPKGYAGFSTYNKKAYQLLIEPERVYQYLKVKR